MKTTIKFKDYKPQPYWVVKIPHFIRAKRFRSFKQAFKYAITYSRYPINSSEWLLNLG